MKTPIPAASVNRRTALLTLAGSALQLAGCGGGVDVAGLSSGGTGSFTSGTIVGLGSIIVNGIRYDDSQATINGMRYDQSSNPLKLGMVVSIQGSATQASGTAGAPLKATASAIRYGSEWRGPIDSGSIDTGNGTFTLLGQTVDVLAGTVFDGVADLAGLAALAGSSYVEVYGYLDPSSGRLQASRIEFKPTLDDYRLSGVVQQKTPSSFTLGIATSITTIAYSAATPQPASWDPGALVHVRLDSSRNALEISTPAQQVLGGLKLDDGEAELEGIVSAYQAGSARLTVNGIEIDGSRITGLKDLGLAPGMLVEIEGRITGNRILASQIEVKGSPAALKDLETEYEFHGTLSQLDTVNHRFMLRGYNIGYDPLTLKLDFQLRNDLTVEVKAVLSGGGLQAVEIGLED